jgi:hypothetical protein
MDSLGVLSNIRPHPQKQNSVQQQQKQKAPLKSTEDEYLSGRIMFGKLKHIMKSKTAEPSELTQLTNQIEQIA